jgi:hypothetical protein
MMSNLKVLPFPGHQEQEARVTDLIVAIKSLVTEHKAVLSDVCLTSRPVGGGIIENSLSLEVDVGGLV